jgi:hypothetical protein
LRRDNLTLQKRLYKAATSERRHQVTNTKSEEKLAYAARA